MHDFRLDYAFAVMAIDERVASLRRERRLQAQLGHARRLPEPRPRRRRGWAVGDLVGRLAPNRSTR